MLKSVCFAKGMRDEFIWKYNKILKKDINCIENPN